MILSDLKKVTNVHKEVFVRQNNSKQWMHCNFNAYPRILIYVASTAQDEIIGYIQWIQKSGFREEAVIELEQIAVLAIFRNHGVGKRLINESLCSINKVLREDKRTLKSILVTTRADNNAQSLYSSALCAKVVATISDLYSHDEVIMLANEGSWKAEIKVADSEA